MSHWSMKSSQSKCGTPYGLVHPGKSAGLPGCLLVESRLNKTKDEMLQYAVPVRTLLLLPMYFRLVLIHSVTVL